MLDSLFRFQDAATACGDLANQLLTTVLDGYGRRWMLRTAGHPVPTSRPLYIPPPSGR